jgi:hypothetical protein
LAKLSLLITVHCAGDARKKAHLQVFECAEQETGDGS